MLRSLKGRLAALWGTAVALIFFMLLLFIVIMTRQVYRDYRAGSQDIADSCASYMNENFSAMNQAVETLFTSNTGYRQLITEKTGDFEWIGNCSYLTSAMEAQAANMLCTGGMFFFESDRPVLWSSYCGISDSAPKKQLDEKLKAFLTGAGDSSRLRQVADFGESIYYICFYSVKGKMIGYIVDMNSLLDTVQDADVYVSFDGQVIPLVSEFTGTEEALKFLKTGEDRTLSGVSAACAEVASASFGLVLFRRTPSFKDLFIDSSFVLVFLVLVLLVLMVLFVSYRIMNRTLVVPVRHIVKRIDSLKKGEAETEKETVRIEEYARIHSQIDALLNEIGELNEARFREERRANDALLQYYQLQVNPHFYLNCLNSINSLIEKQAPEAAKQMIMSLSSHFRYVFQSSRSLVTLEEEIRETRDYCLIQSMKGGIPILFHASAEPGTEKIRVPILAIQTLTENSIKHVSRDGKILNVSVTASECENNGEKYVRIDYRDNGLGYPSEQLPELNAEVKDFRYVVRHVGIINLKYRISLLYGSRGTIRFENRESGGAGAVLILPEEENEHTGD